MAAITRPIGFGFGTRLSGSFAGKTATEVAAVNKQYVFRPIAYRNNPTMPWITRIGELIHEHAAYPHYC